MRSLARYWRRLERTSFPEVFVLTNLYGYSIQEIADYVGRSRTMMTYYLTRQNDMPPHVKKRLARMVADALEETRQHEPQDREFRGILSSINDVARQLTQRSSR